MITNDPLETLDVFCQNKNQYLLAISNPHFEFSALTISLEFGPPGAIFNIKELVIFNKNKQKTVLKLKNSEENGRLICSYHGEEQYSDLLGLFCVLTIDSENIVADMKEELLVHLEFTYDKTMTCALQKSVELNFEKLFEIKFNHYSNPLFSFSNIQLKNLCFYSFHMLSFYLDSKKDFFSY